jgi:hypothetical protein
LRRIKEKKMTIDEYKKAKQLTSLRRGTTAEQELAYYLSLALDEIDRLSDKLHVPDNPDYSMGTRAPGDHGYGCSGQTDGSCSGCYFDDSGRRVQTPNDERCPRCGALGDCPDSTCGDKPEDPTAWKPKKFA